MKCTYAALALILIFSYSHGMRITRPALNKAKNALSLPKPETPTKWPARSMSQIYYEQYYYESLQETLFTSMLEAHHELDRPILDGKWNQLLEMQKRIAELHDLMSRLDPKDLEYI